MDFSIKTDEELEQISASYKGAIGQYLADNAIPAEQKKLDFLLRKANKDISAEKEKLYDFLREYLMRLLKKIALRDYLIMEKSNNWSGMGEQRVSISFCRCLLNIPNNREVTQFDADRFRRMVDDFSVKDGNRSAEYYNNLKRTFSFDFLGVIMKLTLIDPLIQYLELLETPFKLFFSYAPNGYYNFILADCDSRKVGNYGLQVFGKELIRSPHYVLSIAAEQNKQHSMIYIRREACEVIFYNKWQRFYDQTKAERKRSLKHKNSAIREGIKEKALQLYGVKTSADVERIKTLFIDEMIDGIIWHEVGHLITYKHTDAKNVSFAEIFLNTDNVYCITGEAQADWAPHEGELKGAIARFVEIAKTDKQKALRGFYVYLSDNWFIDEEEEFMSLQTDILNALALHAVEPDGSVNFSLLEKATPKIHDFLVKFYEKTIADAVAIVEQGTFDVGVHKLNYIALQKEILKIFKDQKVVTTIEEMVQRATYWFNLWSYIKKFSPETKRKLDEFFDFSANELRAKLLKIISKGDTSKYKDSLREYIYIRYAEVGVLKPEIQVDAAMAVRRACESMKMPEKIIEKVLDRAQKIIKGENYDISISYEGEKDPFIATIQELMLKSGYGDIRAGMTMGEYMQIDDPADKKKLIVKDELENIRDQIESEMYMEIDKLKINAKYNVRPMVDELLETLAFFDNKKLKDKIKEITYEDTASNALFEVFIPLKRGFMDWNTSQAVWRINQDLRPDEFIMQWTIDKEFIEALAETYQ